MTQKKSSFRGKVSQDIQKEKNEYSSFGYLKMPQGVKMYNVEGKIREIELDIIPYVVTDPNHPNRNDAAGIAAVGDLWYRRPFKIHRNVGAEDEAVICPKSVGKPCPLCEYQRKRYKEGADKDELSALRAKDRNLYAVIPVNSEKHEEVVYIWEMAKSLFQDTLSDEIELHPENEVFPDLEEGKTLQIALKWKSLGKNTYPEARAITFNKREPYDESILDEVPSLDDMLKILTYEQLEAKFFNDTSEPDGGELQDDEPAEDPKPAPKRKPKSLRGSHSSTDNPPEVKEKEEEKDAPIVRRRRKVVKTEDAEKCPHAHKFGADYDLFSECETCEIWQSCMEENEKGNA